MAKTQQNTINSNDKFTVTFGIKGVDKIPANHAVLLNECKVRGENGYVPATEFMAISGVKSTKMTDLILPVLAIMLADTRTRGGFANDYKVVVVGKEKIETKLSAKSAFTKWLKGNVIYKSNSEGALNKALVLDNGLYLRNTALKVSEKQPIYSAKGDALRVLMHKTAEAISAQATMFSDILKEAKQIFETAQGTDTQTQTEKTAKVA